MVVDPLGEVADLQIAIDALELEETSPMKAVMIHMTNKIYSKSIQQVNIKKQHLSSWLPPESLNLRRPLVPVNLADKGNVAAAAVLFDNSGQNYSLSSVNFIMVLLRV